VLCRCIIRTITSCVFFVWTCCQDDEDEGISDVSLEHETVCTMCGEDGDLVECSTCPSSFHLDCHDPPLRHIPRSGIPPLSSVNQSLLVIVTILFKLQQGWRLTCLG